MLFKEMSQKNKNIAKECGGILLFVFDISLYNDNLHISKATPTMFVYIYKEVIEN